MTEKQKPEMNFFQVAVAAEAYAAAILAQAGCNVSIQYGANQPEYDLIATKKNISKKISVKGSKDGGWVLLAGFKKGLNYHEAADAWAQNHEDSSVIYCFVKFKDISFGEMPRIYFASIPEIVEYIKASRGGHGDTVLHEIHSWKGGSAKGCEDQIPPEWIASIEHIEQIMRFIG